MYGIADLDNCYCSCEKVFRPDLEGKPIVVLSNNDGCVVARSNEAKKKSICTSRSFNGMISDKDTLRTHIANYAARCAEKLRTQKTVATTVGVFVNTNAIKHDFRSTSPTTRWGEIMKLNANAKKKEE